MPRPSLHEIVEDAELVRLVGEANILWDDIEVHLWNIFDTLLNVHWRYSYLIFFSHQNHRARREMLESLASIALASDQGRLKKLKSLLGRVKRAAKKRNEITHGVWNAALVAGNREIVRVPLKNSPPKEDAPSLSKKELKAARDQMAKLEDDLYKFAHVRWLEKVQRKKENRGWSD